jgi:hypothetical protein
VWVALEVMRAATVPSAIRSEIVISWSAVAAFDRLPEGLRLLASSARWQIVGNKIGG